MHRRKFNALPLLVLAAVGSLQGRAWALTLEQLTQGEALGGLRTALEQGARTAIQQLGRVNGFLGNPQVKIQLPRQLQDAEPLLSRFGMGGQLEELVTSMNRAAEAAVPMALDMMVTAVRSMSVADAKKILGGGETAATEYFAEKTRAPLGQKFMPIVSQTTAKVGLARQYNDLAGRAADLGLMGRDEARIEQHVTQKALDGMYFMVGAEERKIRRDPVGSGSALLQKVFGAIR